MSSISVIVPQSLLTLTDQRNQRLRAIAAGYVRAHEKGVGKIKPEEISGFDAMTTEAKVNAVAAKVNEGWKPKELDIHELQNLAVDITAAPGVNDWLTAALAVVGIAYSCFQAVNPTVPANKIH